MDINKEEFIDKSIAAGEELAENIHKIITEYLEKAPSEIHPLVVLDVALLEAQRYCSILQLKTRGKNFAIRSLTSNFKLTLEILLDQEEIENSR